MQVVVLVTAVMGDHLKNLLEIEKMKLAYVASLTVSVMMCASATMAQVVLIDGTLDGCPEGRAAGCLDGWPVGSRLG